MSPRNALLAVLLVATTLSCGDKKAGAARDHVLKSCLRAEFPDAVCQCVIDDLVSTRGNAALDAMSAEVLQREVDPLYVRCTVSTGALAPKVKESCLEVVPFRDNKSTICDCAAERIAKDERVRDVTDRLPEAPFPSFAQAVMFSCAYERGAVDNLLYQTCGAAKDKPGCVCLVRDFKEKFPPSALSGMSADTLAANVTDVHERCLVEADDVKDGLMTACQRAEKKKSVCECAVDWFLERVPPRDVLNIVRVGWTTDSMDEMHQARRECSGKSAPKKRRR